MASVIVKNTRLHDIVLNIGQAQVVIPAGIDGPEGLAPGYATVDDSLITEGKKNEVIAAYFEQGYLQLDKAPRRKTEE